MHSEAGTQMNFEEDFEEDIDEDICIGEDFQGEDDDINIVDDGSARDAETNKFDLVVGALQDILMDPEFEDMRDTFCRTNCQTFEDSDENKLEYTNIFAAYTELVESDIETRLKTAVPGFNMTSFLNMLDARKDELMSDVFDLLLSLADFESFKEVMLSYKREVADGGSLFHIQCTPVCMHIEEQEDGEERPDLDFGLQISPIGNGSKTDKFMVVSAAKPASGKE